jgi:hypothetical protein
MLTVEHALFMSGLGQSSTQSVETVIYGWGQYKDRVSNLPKAEQDKIDHLADLIVSSFAQSALPPYRNVIIVGHADKDWQGAKLEDTVAGNRAEAVEEALTNKVLDLWDDRHMGPPPTGGVEWQTSSKGAEEMIAAPYHSQNRRVVVRLIRSGPPVLPVPVPVVDNLRVRIERAVKLLDTIGVKPDSTGKRTSRTRCMLEKLKPPAADPNKKPANILDLFVDGTASNDTVNGFKVGFWLVSWAGNYDPPPVSATDLLKFTGMLESVLRTSACAPSASDDTVLKTLSALNYMITHGIVRIQRYITHNATSFGYSGDHTRNKLNTIIADHLNDANSIYSCFKDYTGGEFDGNEPLPGGTAGTANFSY